MPLFVAALLGGLINIAATLAGRVLLSLGFAAVTYTGLSASLTWLRTEALTNLQLLPPEVIAMLGYMKIGVAMSIIASALSARMLLDGLSAGGAISKLVKR
jgi:hypothetical protein